MAKKGPKRIAGVKVPKQMRKKLGKAGDFLQHPLVADLAAAALIAAAAALRENKNVRSAARTAKTKAGDAAQGLGTGVASLGTIIAAKAREGADMVGHAYKGIGSSNGGGPKGGASASGKPRKAKAKKGKK